MEGISKIIMTIFVNALIIDISSHSCQAASESTLPFTFHALSRSYHSANQTLEIFSFGVAYIDGMVPGMSHSTDELNSSS